jgi:hypothetical protein
MSEPKFTPGPWEWWYDGGGTYSVGQAPDAQANPPHITIWDHDHERASANARLVAAVPKMGAMLLSMYLHVSHGGPTREEAEILLREAGLLDDE